MEELTKKVAPSKINHKNAKKNVFKLSYVAKRTFKRPRNASTQPSGAPRSAGVALSTGAARRRFVDSVCSAKRCLTAVAARSAWQPEVYVTYLPILGQH